MCCINIDPKAFLNWANPILLEKERIRVKVHQEYNTLKKAFYARPWWKRGWLGEFDPYHSVLYHEFTKAGMYRMPVIKPEKYIPLANGKEMPLDTSHDFFRG